MVFIFGAIGLIFTSARVTQSRLATAAIYTTANTAASILKIKTHFSIASCLSDAGNSRMTIYFQEGDGVTKCN